MARTLEMDRAKDAWDRVQKVKVETAVRGRYGARVRDLGALIITDGLGQSLAYLRAKGKPTLAENKRKPEHNAHLWLFNHLSEWVMKTLDGASNGTEEHLLGQLIKNDQNYYRRATVETLAYLTWLKKFAEAEFGEAIDQDVATDSMGDDS